MATYKLTVGDIKDILLDKESATTTFGDSQNVFKVSMESITYTKRIFAPCEIHTVLSVTAKDSSTKTMPTIGDLQDAFSRKIVTLKDGETELASNYFVFKMKPSIPKASQDTAALKVELFIFSLDKLLTVDKYCNAFTAKQLGKEIFMNELPKFWLGDKNIMGDVNLQILNYTDGSDSVEIRQPYLVQYNECFYDFLARSASRCGEMLYFDGGKLHLGMKPNTTTATTDQTTIADSVDFEDCVENVIKVEERHYNYFDNTGDDDNRFVDSTFQILGKFKEKKDPVTTDDESKGQKTVTEEATYENGTATKTVQTDYYVSDVDPDKLLKGLPIKVITTMSLVDNSDNTLLKVTETIEYTYQKDGSTYKKENEEYVYTTKKSRTVEGSKKSEGVYNQPYSNDALLHEVEKNGYTSFGNEWGDWRVFLFQELFLNLMNSTTLYDFIADLAVGQVFAMAKAGYDTYKKNKDNNDTNLTLTTEDNPDQTDGTNFNLFSTLDSKIKTDSLAVNTTGDKVSLLVSAFYKKIRHYSKEVSKLKVKLNYGSSDQGLTLGDVVLVSDSYYIVTKVELNDKKDYIVEAIPSFNEVTSETLSTIIPCPPLMSEIPTVRTSEPQVAFVDGNLDPDKLGRVRIKYPWQSVSDASSPWVRMATPFATNGGGVTFKPCNGDEVLINYEDGNIERPYIVGSLQSKYVTDNWGSLSDRVIQSKNGHSITFNDNDDAVDFLAGMSPGLSFLKFLIPNIDPLCPYQDLVDLTGGIKITDRYGLYSINMSSDGRAVSINSPLGDVSLNAFTGITVSAPNGNIEIKGKNVTIAASNKLTLESGSAVSDRYIKKEAFTSKDGFLTSVVGIGTDMLDRTLGKLIDLSFFRTIFEVFTRPVDGTLKIRSNTYLLLEAGKGSAQVPHADFNRPKWEGVQGNDYVAQAPLLGQLTSSIDSLQENANKICGAIKTAFDEAKASAEAYKNFKLEDNVVYDKLTKLKLDGNNNIIKTVFDKKDDKNFDIKDIVKEEEFDFDNNEVLKLLAENKVVPEEPALDSEHPEESWSEWSDWNETKKHIEAEKKRDKDVIKPTRKKYVEMGQDLGVKLKALFDAVKKWKDFDFTQQQKDKGYFSDALKGKIQGLDIFTDFIDNVSKGTVDLTKDISTTYDAELTKLHRAMIYELITEVKSENGYKDMFSVDSKATKPDFGDDAEWKKYADYIGDPTSVASYDVGAKTYFKNYFKTNFLNDWIDAVGNPLSNQWKWKAPEKGRILISDTPGRTIHFDAEQLVTDRNFGEVTNSHPIELRRIVNAVK